MLDADNAIGREIRQTKPFRSKSQEAMLGLFRTTDLLHRFVAETLDGFGVTVQQYNVLRILRGAQPDGLATLAIADRMVERTPGITRMLDRLEAKSWVTRERGREDRRCVHCRITNTGLALLAQLDEPVAAADNQVLAMLTEDEQETLVSLLDRVRAGHADTADSLAEE